MADSIMFPIQNSKDFSYQYENEFILKARDEEKITEVIFWCVKYSIEAWSYIKIDDHINIDPKTERTVENCKEWLEEYPQYDALDYFGQGSYKPYIRLTFLSKKDALHFKMVWG